MLRGASGSRPRATVRCIACSCPATIVSDRREPLGGRRRDGDRPAGHRKRLGRLGHDDEVRIELVAQRRELGDQAGRRRAGADDRDERHARLDEGDGTVGEVGGRIRVREDVRELLDLDRPTRGRWRTRSRARSRGCGPRSRGARAISATSGSMASIASSAAGMAATAARSAGSSVSAADSAATASSDAVYVLVAAIERSGPAERSTVQSAARRERRPGLIREGHGRGALPAGRVDHREDVRRFARLADGEHQRAWPEPRIRAVDRDDRRRRETCRQPVPDPQDVLRVDGRVIRGAAGGDDHVLDAAVADRRGEGLDRAAVPGLGREQARGGCGLLEDSSRTVTGRPCRWLSSVVLGRADGRMPTGGSLRPIPARRRPRRRGWMAPRYAENG